MSCLFPVGLNDSTGNLVFYPPTRNSLLQLSASHQLVGLKITHPVLNVKEPDRAIICCGGDVVNRCR